MKNTIHAACLLFSSLFILSCNNEAKQPAADSASVKKDSATGSTYKSDADFLRSHGTGILELTDPNGQAKVLLSAAYQGRVMTSTASGDSGPGFGWINYKLIASGEKKKQFNPIGGEERFWLGPEGGQYSIYFKQGDSFNINHWQVPALIDTETYTIASTAQNSATFTKNASLVNYSGTHFDIAITRKISLLSKPELEKKIEATIPDDLQFVAFETKNEVKNTGKQGWTKDKGLLSTWLLGMMTPTNETRVVTPFHPGADSRGYITDNYFGAIPADRLSVKDSVLFFRCDGKARGKIGISPKIAKPLAASFDFSRNVLTLIIPQVHPGSAYVNSKWELQKEPYKGDVINSYNDGPLADGTQMGPFYEIESSSPAMELKPGETSTYSQTTCHITGDYTKLKTLALQLLHVDLDELKKW